MRRGGNVEGDSFNSLGQSRRLLNDLSNPRGGSPPARPTGRLPPRTDAGEGEGYAGGLEGGAKGGGRRMPEYGGGEYARESAGVPGQQKPAGGMQRKRTPGRRRGEDERYESKLFPGDYGYGKEVNDGFVTGNGDSEYFREPLPPPLPPQKDDNFGRKQPRAAQRPRQENLNQFGRNAGGANYQYYDRQPSSAPRGWSLKRESLGNFVPRTRSGEAASFQGGWATGNYRYTQQRPDFGREYEVVDYEDADEYYKSIRSLEPDSTSFERRKRPKARSFAAEANDGFDGERRRITSEQQSAQDRADSLFDRRRQMSQASFGDARNDFEERMERQSTFEKRRLDRDAPEQTKIGAGGDGFRDSLSSQRRAGREFGNRRTLSQRSFGDARDDFGLDQRRARRNAGPRETPYESKLLSKVQRYPRMSSNYKNNDKLKQDFGFERIKNMVDDILIPSAEKGGGASAADRMMSKVNSDIDRSIADERKSARALLRLARNCLLADPAVKEILGGALTMDRPLSKTVSSTMVDSVTTSRIQLVIPIKGSKGEGRVQLVANQDEIEQIELESYGRIVNVRLDGPEASDDVMDVDAYYFPNSEGR